jgi:hypothetical protein
MLGGENKKDEIAMIPAISAFYAKTVRIFASPIS